MLYFAEDKRSIKPFRKILEGVGSFLELCEPESRCPLYIAIAEGANLSDSRAKQYLRKDHYLCEGYDPGFVKHCLGGGSDFTVLNPAQMMEKVSCLPDIAEDPCREVEVRWFPLVTGSREAQASPFPLRPYFAFDRPGEPPETGVVNFIHAGQTKSNPIRGTIWVLVYLATPFETPDGDFRRFHEEANKRFPLKLQKSKWRFLTSSATGRPVIRKIAW